MRKKASSKRALGAALTEESAASESGTTGAEEEVRSRIPAWEPRPYQAEALRRFDDGQRRQVLIWHRRAGKDNFAMNLAKREADRQVGTYWHLYPTHTQARRAIWNGIDKRGHRFIDLAFPKSEREATRTTDMQIVLKNGSMWQLAGSDRFNSLVGSNPLGVVFSEWALCDPRAWDYVRPIIRENGGWCAFITTYRGRNHAYRMFHRLNGSAGWYCDLRTVEDTTDNDGNRIITDADIEAERAEGMSESLIRQEYYCDPIASQPGAIYGRQMSELVESHRLQTVAHDKARPVYAAWSNRPQQHTVAFFQTRGNEVRLIGSRSFPFSSISEAIEASRSLFPWRYIARDVIHGGASSEVVEAFENNDAVVELASKDADLVEPARDLIGRLYIDDTERPFTEGELNNARMVDALNGYRFRESSAGTSFTDRPVDSWESHYAHCLENFASYLDDRSATGDGWHKAPSTEQLDRACI